MWLRVSTLGLMAVVMLAGCHGAGPQGQGGHDTPAGGASASAGATSAPPTMVASAGNGRTSVAVTTRGTASTLHEQTELYSFDYAYPAAAGAIPALKTWLDHDAGSQRTRLAREARQGAMDAKGSDYPFRPYALDVEWQVVTDLPDWLSLSARLFSDSGGAHPNHGTTALLWDKRMGVRRAATDLFTSKAAFTAAITAPFCAALNAERAKRRGAPVNPDSGDDFDKCIDPAASTVILGSSSHKVFDRIGILIDPYDAGPYAEGDYEITLKVTPAVLAAVRPQYRAAFALGH